MTHAYQGFHSHRICSQNGPSLTEVSTENEEEEESAQFPSRRVVKAIFEVSGFGPSASRPLGDG